MPVEAAAATPRRAGGHAALIRPVHSPTGAVRPARVAAARRAYPECRIGEDGFTPSTLYCCSAVVNVGSSAPSLHAHFPELAHVAAA